VTANEGQRGNFESLLQDLLFRALQARFAEDLADEGTLAFTMAERCGGGRCACEGRLEYAVGPDSAVIGHRTDILLSLPNDRLLAIELKVAARTSAFKARAYDMLHLKQRYGSLLVGVMVHARVPGSGISSAQARRICYMVDRFVARDVHVADDVDHLVTAAVDVVDELVRRCAVET
jgi:hypothetical protein